MTDKTAQARHSKDYRDRKKAKKERLGIESIAIETARGVRERLTDAMAAHGYSQLQELLQDMVLSFLAAPPIEQASRLRKPDASAFFVTSKMARQFEQASLAALRRDSD